MRAAGGVDGFDGCVHTGIRRQHGCDNRDNRRLLRFGDFDNPWTDGSKMRGGDSFRRRPVKGRWGKIDRMELHRNIELLCARSARRRALLAQRQRRKRGLLGLLQFRHPRSRIRETGHGPCRVDYDCLSRVISHDDPPIPGHDLERAVRQVLVRYGAVIQERIVPARGLAFLNGGERQCGECQDADPAILRGASDRRERRIDVEDAGPGYLAGNETEGALDQTEQGRIRGARALARKFVQHQARGGGKIEHSAVDESYADGAIGSGLDRIALIDQGTDAGSNKHPVGAHDGDGTDRRPDFADSFEWRGRQHLDGTDDEAFARHIARVTKHVGFPLPLGLRAASLLPFPLYFSQYAGAIGSALLAALYPKTCIFFEGIGHELLEGGEELRVVSMSNASTSATKRQPRCFQYATC